MRPLLHPFMEWPSADNDKTSDNYLDKITNIRYMNVSSTGCNVKADS